MFRTQKLAMRSARLVNPNRFILPCLGVNALSTRGFSSISNIRNLVYAASGGDLAEIKDLVENENVDLNVSNYDNRSALHLAAAEGHTDVVQYFVENGANVNPVDRFGYTPLEDALSAQGTELVRYLRENGACFGESRLGAIANGFCAAAAGGDLVLLERFLEAGTDVNTQNSDNRTALHLAASEGQTAVVEFLIKNGANVNSVDRFENTPLQDAQRHSGRTFRACARILEENGAQNSTIVNSFFSQARLQSSLQSSLPLLCQFGNFGYAEVYTALPGENEFSPLSWFADKHTIEPSNPFLSAWSMEPTRFSADSTIAKVGQERKGHFGSDSIADFPYRHHFLKQTGFQSFLSIPLVQDDHLFAVIRFCSSELVDMSPEQREHFTTYAHGMISAGVMQTLQAPCFDESIDEDTKQQMTEVYNFIVDEDVFSAPLAFQEVQHFYQLGLPRHYFRFPSHIIAQHIHCYMAAKKLSETEGTPEKIWLHIENNPILLGGSGGEQCLYMISSSHKARMAAERRIAERIELIPGDKSYRLEFYESKKSPVVGDHHSDARLALYMLQTEEFANPDADVTDTNIWDVASEQFLADTTKVVRERYQEVMRDCASRLAPVARLFSSDNDNKMRLMFGFHHDAPTMNQLSQLMNTLGLSASQKFVQTFSNTVTCVNVYLDDDSDPETVEKLMKQFTMLHMVPQSVLTEQFLNSQMGADAYSFCSASARFAYYFINQRTDEFDTLSDYFQNDPMNLARLRTLNGTLKREAVSLRRIYETILSNPEIVREVYSEFKKQTTGARTGRADALMEKIRLGYRELDQQILEAMTILATHTCRTNFWSRKKAAISFRLDPSFISLKEWPVQPYGMYFLMGREFQGFHVRFDNIARGGIRMITSNSQAVFQKNMASLFQENYGLAYTQNKKNKDIPEFGSKGTILLFPNVKSQPFYAFQSYTSAILDLLNCENNPDIVDNLGQPEILFFGPDEGTADFMNWACLHAESVGYDYWRSFTTGKPQALGGIPHDIFGMTTRSVHQNVLGVLDKEGLVESEVTKVQTGGPDGDLGSNEILMSEDKTVAIVDGSGVLFDPEGLDRGELVRLAEERSMIVGFDAQHLGPQGFKVLVGDRDFKLPNGEVVVNGEEFRNTFHFHPLCKADFFVPCGGRPESVKLADVPKMFDENGAPKYKYIVEGANLFISQDARLVLEEKGVHIMKDATTNKGGVTCSSHEVLAALALDDSTFSKNMAVTNPASPPEFYSRYVDDVIGRLEGDARREFNLIWDENKRTGVPKPVLTDIVSEKINVLTGLISNSALYEDQELRRSVLQRALPKTLQELAGLDNILVRVPDMYLKAIFCTFLASRYIYTKGIDSNEFSFYLYMKDFQNQSE